MKLKNKGYPLPKNDKFKVSQHIGRIFLSTLFPQQSQTFSHLSSSSAVLRANQWSSQVYQFGGI